MKTEILAPAGSYESLLAAIHNGADAIYLGGASFGARALAGNFTTDQLKEAIDYVHYHGKKIYLTVNTLLKHYELEEQLYEYILPFYEHGIDAVIVQDIGVLRYLHRHFPCLEFHASTQMSVTNVEAAKLLKQYGVTRIVPARELSLEEIWKIKQECQMEIESFVHGALCYCYSGHCLLSSMIGGRSGNRGRCAQPCRLPYETKTEDGKVLSKAKDSYRLSLKDLCAIEEIPDMVKHGVDSFKIEGRMKKPEYVAMVTKMYRKYLDQYLQKPENLYAVSEDDYKQLMELYNRGGFTDGYYTKHNGKDMVSMHRPNHQGLCVGTIDKIKGNQIVVNCKEEIFPQDILEIRENEKNITELTSPVHCEKNGKLTLNANHLKQLRVGMSIFRMKNKSLIGQLEDSWTKQTPHLALQCHGTFQVGKESKLQISGQGFSCEVTGNIVQNAKNQPMTEEKISSLLKKTGGTPYFFSDITLDVVGDVFLSVQEIKELRRQGIRAWEETVEKHYRRVDALPKIVEDKQLEEDFLEQTPEIVVSVYTTEQLEEVLKWKEISAIYLELVTMTMEDAVTFADKIHETGKKCYLAFPQIFRQTAEKEWEKELSTIISTSFDGYVVRNLEEYARLKQGLTGSYERKEWVLDYTLHQYNQETRHFYQENGQGHTITSVFPLELNYSELLQLNIQNGELVIYGRLPLMVSAQCQWKQTKGCIGETKPVILRDRKQSDLFVLNQCKYCYNTIYSDSPLCLYDEKDKIKKLSVKQVRLQFIDETKEMVKKRLEEAIAIFYEDKEVVCSLVDFMKGHWKRGIE